MGKLKGRQLVISISAMVALAGCEDGKGPNFEFLKKKPASQETAEVTRAATATSLVEKDVEAPDVFSKTEEGLWDGRPSLGGVWVAHADVKDPERVLIRNEANGKSVIGALFKRERLGPGPALQLSSDAADALVVVAGAPIQLSVIALRKEEVPVEAPAVAEAEGDETLPKSTEITTASLDAPADTADAAKPKPVETAAAKPKQPETVTRAAAQTPVVKPINDPVLGSRLPKKTGQKVNPVATAQAAIARSGDTATKPVKASARASGALSKPYIQIGIFSVKSNADNTATSLRNIGILPTVKEQTSKGKVFWRVVVGPASSGSERGTLLKKVKQLGFNDAYFVTN